MTSPKCRVCGNPVPGPERVEGRLRLSPYYPFCSERCKMIDFGRWMNQRYSISRPLPEAEDELDSDTPDA